MNFNIKYFPDIPRPILAALCMISGGAALALNHSLVRIVAAELPILEVSALRFIWAVPIMLLFLINKRSAVLRTKRHGLHFITSTLTVVMTATFFIALSKCRVSFDTSFC